MNYFKCEKNGLKVWVTEQNLNYHQSFNNNSVSRKTYRLKDINGIELFYNKKDMSTAMTCLVFAGIFFLLTMIGFISQIPVIGLIYFCIVLCIIHNIYGNFQKTRKFNIKTLNHGN